jgi:hypothetical protein
MIGTGVPTGSPSYAKYCSTKFNELNTLVVIESIKTTKSNDVIRKLEPTFYFQLNMVYGRSIKHDFIFSDVITAFPKCSFLDPSGWKRIDVELRLHNDMQACKREC